MKYGTGIPVLGVILSIFIGVYLYTSRQSRMENLKIEDEKHRAELAVSQLPEGVEQAWLSHVENKFHQRIKRGPRSIWVTENTSLSQATLVSVNTPYTITCSVLLGGTIKFGYGDDSLDVELFQYPQWEGQSGRPGLGVNRNSIAAKALMETLCQRIAQMMAPLAR